MALGGEGYLNFIGNEFAHPDYVELPSQDNGWSFRNAIRRFDLPDAEDLKYKFFEAFDEAMLALDNRFQFMASVPTAVPITAPTTTPAPSTTQGPLLFGTQGPSALDQMAQEFMDEAGKLNPESEEHKSLQSVAKMLHKMSAPAVTDQPLISSMPMTSTTNSQTKQTQALGHAAENALDSPLAPHEALQDGNRCPSDEEEFPSTKGNCYKKCADLTGGYYPIRTSAFSCCASEPCTFFNSKTLGFDFIVPHLDSNSLLGGAAL
eukprot:g1380.t1